MVLMGDFCKYMELAHLIAVKNVNIILDWNGEMKGDFSVC